LFDYLTNGNYNIYVIFSCKIFSEHLFIYLFKQGKNSYLFIYLNKKENPFSINNYDNKLFTSVNTQKIETNEETMN